MRYATSGPQGAVFSYFDFDPAVHSFEKPYEILINFPSAVKDSPGYQRTNQRFQNHHTVVEDIRGREENFSLDVNGVCWRNWEAPERWQGLDGEALKQLGHDGIASLYIGEVEAFIKGQLEAEGDRIDKVKVFDYKLRISMDEKDFTKRTVDLSDGLDPMIPVTHPHVDQSFEGAIRRVNHHMGEEAASLLTRRFRIINVWRPLKPVKSWPLAVCDTQTVDLDDLVRSDLVRRKMIGETFYSRYNSKHRWYYLSDQQPHEVTMLKIYDSDQLNQARFCLHSAFQYPEAGAEPRRESFEVRAMVFDKIRRGDASNENQD